MKAIQKIFLSVILFSLCSCGFQPIYSSDQYSDLLSKIKITIINKTKIPSKLDVQLKDNLKNRFNPGGLDVEQKYELVLNLQSVLTSFQTQNNTVSTRTSIKLIADYQLLDIATRKVILRDVVTSIDSFQIADSPYSAMITEEGTAYNMTREMANEISNRISSYEVENASR